MLAEALGTREHGTSPLMEMAELTVHVFRGFAKGLYPRLWQKRKSGWRPHRHPMQRGAYTTDACRWLQTDDSSAGARGPETTLMPKVSAQPYNTSCIVLSNLSALHY